MLKLIVFRWGNCCGAWVWCRGVFRCVEVNRLSLNFYTIVQYAAVYGYGTDRFAFVMSLCCDTSVLSMGRVLDVLCNIKRYKSKGKQSKASQIAPQPPLKGFRNEDKIRSLSVRYFD